jgi:hypothetical protein
LPLHPAQHIEPAATLSAHQLLLRDEWRTVSESAEVNKANLMAGVVSTGWKAGEGELEELVACKIASCPAGSPVRASRS